jgi:hypothetical protein
MDDNTRNTNCQYKDNVHTSAPLWRVHYIAEDIMHIVLFREMVSVSYWNGIKIIRTIWKTAFF